MSFRLKNRFNPTYMADKGTGYIVEIDIEAINGKTMDDLDFNVEFFISNTRTKAYTKEDMVRVRGITKDRYFVLLDSSVLGIGHLMARTEIKDSVEKWENGVRPIVITKYTGKAVGVNTTPETLQPCTFRILQQANNEIYEEGYCVKFRFWNRLPKDEYSYIYFGKLTVPISSFADITADMVQGLNHIDALKMEKTSLGEINVGETIIVAVPEDVGNKAYKDNGFDEPMKFAEEILGSNGGHTVVVDGINYRIFGELMIVNGEMFVYVE